MSSSFSTRVVSSEPALVSAQPRKGFGAWMSVMSACWAVAAVASVAAQLTGTDLHSSTTITAGPLEDTIAYLELLRRLLIG